MAASYMAKDLDSTTQGLRPSLPRRRRRRIEHEKEERDEQHSRGTGPVAVRPSSYSGQPSRHA